ncbi:MAG: cell envelope integrity protein TolA, partial [Desulfovibrionaceae bacterium]|nr:cell envelope integrity protein TolA [Desulfovibrionaceae bacterium]
KHSGGHSGGGGGEGEGEGGGGIGDVYGAQIVMAVQPNWHWPAQAKGSLSVTLYLKIDATGRVLDVRVEESSGNAVFDSSAVSAVRVTHMLPPPPSPAYREIVLSFFPIQ